MAIVMTASIMAIVTAVIVALGTNPTTDTMKTNLQQGTISSKQ